GRESTRLVQVGVIEQLVGPHNGGERQPFTLEDRTDFGRRELREPLAYDGHHPFTGLDPQIVGSKPCVLLEVLEPEGIAEEVPLCIADHGQEDLLVVAYREDVVYAPG